MKRVMFLALLVIAYAGFASGVKPFTTLAYVLVALPSLAIVVMYSVQRGLTPSRDDVRNYYVARSNDASLTNVVPWLSLFALAVALEVVGLALGGRNKTVPTLSTTVDHLLVTREGRWLLYVLWLSVGIGPLLRLWQHRDTARI
jgi:hypothetical protein